MHSCTWRLGIAVLVTASLGRLVVASDADAERVDYSVVIKPLLKARCIACHGPLKQEAGLRLDTGEAIRLGSRESKIVHPGDKSGPLLERISSSDNSIRMPPEGERLTDRQIRQISRWIEQGAHSPVNEQPELDPRQHWAFLPPKTPNVPHLSAEVPIGWSENPIDSFIAEKQIQHGLQRQARADKGALLRRVTIDLTGIPPTVDELQTFLTDPSPDAYTKVIDRLLGSAAYGERWGRHWMDVWRYSDWFGRRYVPDVWNSAPQIWRWRDWIVNSLNADKSYGRMVAEMLAGDEIAPEDDQAGFATGYLIRNWYALNPNDWMRSNVEHTGKAFLGLTFNCAHCHDHKYDPITQTDYFRFRAFFEPIGIRQDRVKGEADPGPFEEYQYGVLRKVNRLGGVRIFDKTPDAPTWFYSGGDERNRIADRGSIAPGVPEFLQTASLNIGPNKLPIESWYPGLGPSLQVSMLADHQSTITAAENQLPDAKAKAALELPSLKTKRMEFEAEFEKVRIAAEQAGTIRVLAGRQSLLLDAPAGRKIIHHSLRDAGTFGAGEAIQFQLQILKDAHFNFQLSKDVVKGLTAGLVAFDKGRILSYAPGTSTELEIGRYEFDKGQSRFEVNLLMQSVGEPCLLTIKSISDGRVLIDRVAIARNDWNPVNSRLQAIAFDIRAGGTAVIDDLEVHASTAGDVSSLISPRRIASIGFERPEYEDGIDVLGAEGWFASKFSQAGATSVVSATIGDESLKPVAENVYQTRRAISALELRVQSLELTVAANRAEMESIQARNTAERARYGQLAGSDATELIQSAALCHREASRLTAEAKLVTAKSQLAAAELLPATEPNRSKEISAAQQQLSDAVNHLEKLKSELSGSHPRDHYPSLSPIYPQTSTGRRRALAEWITSRDNPLAARVAVNHIWLRHFHSPLVATVYDFGVSGAKPTHPALLDWLAVELMENDWSMKHLHRLIVTSQTYAMSSSGESNDKSSRMIDPENTYLWHANQGRMEAEVVRDSLLAVAAQLDQRMGGQELENSQALTTRRRTLYYCSEPETDGKSAFGALFDAPEPADCYRRSESIIPQQALALTNSQLIHDLSISLEEFASHNLLNEQISDDSAFITAIYQQALTRRPTDAEQQLCLEFLAAGSSDDSGKSRLRQALIRVLLNHNDFVAIR